MARELDIHIEVQTAQAEAALARTEAGLHKVEQAAGQLHGPLTRLETLEQEQTQQLEEMRKSLDRSEQALKKKADTAKKASPVMAELTTMIRQYAAPAAIGLAIKQTIDFAERIDDLSKKTGIAPSKLQALEFSAKQVGLSLDPVAQSISQLSDRLASGDKSAVSALGRLGLAFNNIRGMSPDKAFISIARAIADVEDPMERARAATDLFGRSGHQLLPLLTSDVDALMKKAEQLGLIIDDKTIKATDNLGDSITTLLDVGKRLIMVFFAPLIPILQTLLNVLTPVTAELGKMINTILSPLENLRQVAEVLGLIQQRLPGVPKGPGATFLPGQLPVPGDPATSGIFGQSLDFTIDRLNDQLKAQQRAREGAVTVPFERPTLFGEGWGAYLARQAMQFNGGVIPGTGVGTFPGWAPLPSAWAGDGLPMVPFAGTVPMHAPGIAGPSWLRGAGGRFLGAGLGAATAFIPGLSGQGSMIGSSFGSAASSLGSVAGALGSFAPFLGPVAGLVGGLIGKLFGPSEATKAGRARSSFIDEFGGMGALTEAAGKAGFSLDALMNARKVADVEREVKKLTDAIGAYEQKLSDANQQLSAMRGEFDGVLRRAEDLGYTFDQNGQLVSVSFERMQEKAKAYGISLDSLGPAFQRQRLHEMAGTIINDFELLTRGGTDVGTVLFGMQDEISKLVQDSIKFGVDIPANMKPWIEELIRTNQLVDENGNLITDLGQIKFADPIVTEFEKITTKLDELITRIGEMVTKIDEMTRPRTINIGYQVEEPPDVNGLLPFSRGGFVPNPRYLAQGSFIPRGTDSVPAMLTPGEGVLRREAVSRLMRGDWPSGGGKIEVSIDHITVGSFENEAQAELQLGRALVRGLKRRGRRLAAA